MSTQLQTARRNVVTSQVRSVSEVESLDVEQVRQGLAGHNLFPDYLALIKFRNNTNGHHFCLTQILHRRGTEFTEKQFLSGGQTPARQKAFFFQMKSK